MKKFLYGALLALTITSVPTHAHIGIIPVLLTSTSSANTASEFVMSEGVVKFQASNGLEIHIHQPENSDDPRVLVLDNGWRTMVRSAELEEVRSAVLEYARQQDRQVKLSNPKSYYYFDRNGYSFDIEMIN